MSKALDCAIMVGKEILEHDVYLDGNELNNIGEIIQFYLDEAEERGAEKMRQAIDTHIGALWANLFDRDLVAKCASERFDHWRGRIRAIDIKQVLKG